MTHGQVVIGERVSVSDNHNDEDNELPPSDNSDDGAENGDGGHGGGCGRALRGSQKWWLCFITSDSCGGLVKILTALQPLKCCKKRNDRATGYVRHTGVPQILTAHPDLRAPATPCSIG